MPELQAKQKRISEIYVESHALKALIWEFIVSFAVGLR